MVGPAASLAFRSLLKSSVNRAGLAVVHPRLTGLMPPALALHAAAVAQEQPLVLIVPTDADVAQVMTDARFFYESLSGATDTDVRQVVLPLPSQEVDPYRGLTPHLEVASARARALYALAAGKARLVVASARALLPRLSDPARLAALGLHIRVGDEIPPRDLADHLALLGFAPEDPVDEHGEFCVRGGVVDLYPAAEAEPVRLEFIGDVIESIRRYDAASQRSLAALDQLILVPQQELLAGPSGDNDPADLDRSATVLDYLRSARAKTIVFELDDVVANGRTLEEQWRASATEMAARGRTVAPYETLASSWTDVESWVTTAAQVSQLAIDDGDAAAGAHVRCQPAVPHHGRLGDWVTEIRAARERNDRVVFVASTPGRAERTIELLADYDVRAREAGRSDDLESAAVMVVTGYLSQGFHLPAAGLQVSAEADLFEEERRAHERRRSAARTFISDFRDLKTGDLVVHVDSGIGRFVGLKKLAVVVGDGSRVGSSTVEQEFMELRYANDDKLFVPIDRLDLVQKYTGGAQPALDRLGGTTWEKAKTRVKKAMRDMAEELLKLYAARKAVAGHAFSAGAHWQQEFDDAFEYELTPDQQSAIADITRDLESTTPMDRLLCGDVGYGKTEVAMRAAFKAVLDGKQVAVLAPTTVLAFQHLRTFQQRFAGFPVKIDLVSRFRTKAEQKVTLDQLAAGQLDIIVGTHRLLSKDVTFRDLGLLIVDEEQRFGVTHKERIKQLRKKVDVLTMTATPIPRTLNMSLVGIRDMSVIETPPRDRLAIQTQVVKFDQEIIRRAVRTELERGGQVYLVHNRVESIFSIANLITRLVPEAKVAVGHGQMGEADLEKVMIDFVAHKFDVLVATTIVENGLDIPNANTIVINRADRYGLAQLYQLRGRVGRSDRRAYAYLLIPAEQTLSPAARKRLAAIKEFSDLGSGFRIAALDLEIRGAGNLLGGQQSGHIEAVGFDMYMKLLEDTIRELKGEELDDDRRAAVNLRLSLKLDETYVPDTNQRLSIYRRMASARSFEEVERLEAEVRDRYGPLPRSVEDLATFTRIRVLADRVGLERLDREGPAVVFKFRQDAALDPSWLFNFVQSRGDITLHPPAVLKLDLNRDPAAAPLASERARSGPGRLVGGRGRDARQGREGQRTQSWWTARATAAVGPGFTKAEVLAEAQFDPAAPGGLFERVGEVLETIADAL